MSSKIALFFLNFWKMTNKNNHFRAHFSIQLLSQIFTFLLFQPRAPAATFQLARASLRSQAGAGQYVCITCMYQFNWTNRTAAAAFTGSDAQPQGTAALSFATNKARRPSGKDFVGSCDIARLQIFRKFQKTTKKYKQILVLILFISFLLFFSAPAR